MGWIMFDVRLTHTELMKFRAWSSQGEMLEALEFTLHGSTRCPVHLILRISMQSVQELCAFQGRRSVLIVLPLLPAPGQNNVRLRGMKRESENKTDSPLLRVGEVRPSTSELKVEC